MAISYVGSAQGTNTATMPAHVAGDLLVVSVVRFGSTTSPTVPGGWTDIVGGTGVFGTNFRKVFYKFAASSSEVVGTWTNANLLTVHVYRGAAIGSFSINFGTSATSTYGAVTLQNNVTSWVYSMGTAVSTSQPVETPRTDETFRVGGVDATGEIASFDTNAAVSSFGAQNVSLGSSVVWATASVELVESPRAVTAQGGSYALSGANAPLIRPSPISFIGAATGTNTATVPVGHQSGDLIVVMAYNLTNTTSISPPTGYTSVLSSSGTSRYRHLSYKYATSSSETISVVSSCDVCMVYVFRGTRISSPITNANPSATTGSTLNTSALNLFQTNGSSWVGLAAVAIGSTTSTIENAPAPTTLRSNAVIGSHEVAMFDTNGGVGAYGAKTLSLGAFTTADAVTFEILAPQNPTMTAVAGAYALTGADTGIIRSYTLSADPGSYALTGADTPFARALLMAPTAGSYTISGADTAINRSLLVTLDAGAYALSGSDVTFISSLIISGAAGAYALSGADTSFVRSMIMSGAAGAYALSGADTTFDIGKYIHADPGTYILDGADVAFVRDMIALVDPGSYALSGSDVGMIRDLIMSGLAEIYSISGSDVLFDRDYVIIGTPGAYDVSGPDVPFVRALLSTQDAGSYTIDGADTSFTRALILPGDAGSYSINGADVTMTEVTISIDMNVYQDGEWNAGRLKMYRDGGWVKPPLKRYVGGVWAAVLD